jgi:hypothetical protein
MNQKNENKSTNPTVMQEKIPHHTLSNPGEQKACSKTAWANEALQTIVPHKAFLKEERLKEERSLGIKDRTVFQNTDHNMFGKSTSSTKNPLKNSCIQVKNPKLRGTLSCPKPHNPTHVTDIPGKLLHDLENVFSCSMANNQLTCALKAKELIGKFYSRLQESKKNVDLSLDQISDQALEKLIEHLHDSKEDN